MRTLVIDALADVDALRRRLVDVLAAIDGHDDGIQVPGQGRWTKDKVATLWNAVRHLEGAQALFEVTAGHPNEAVTFEQVRAASGLTDQRQRNHHARITRIAAELFGEARWPVQSWQSAPAPSGKAEMHYRIGGTIAEWWHELQSGVTE